MTSFQRCFVTALIFSFALSIIAVAQKEEPQEPAGKALELKACGPRDREVKYKADYDKSQHPTGTPAVDTALIYVIRENVGHNMFQSALAVDGEWKGANKGYSYFFFTLPPGEHYFCSKDLQASFNRKTFGAYGRGREDLLSWPTLTFLWAVCGIQGGLRHN